MKESDLMRLIQLEASKYGVRLFRNNVGVLQDKNGRHLRYGLGTGSSDLIGWIGEGKYAGKFIAVEVKVGDSKLTPEQINFLNQVNGAGGIGICARSVQDVIDKLGPAT